MCLRPSRLDGSPACDGESKGAPPRASDRGRPRGSHRRAHRPSRRRCERSNAASPPAKPCARRRRCGSPRGNRVPPPPEVRPGSRRGGAPRSRANETNRAMSRIEGGRLGLRRYLWRGRRCWQRESGQILQLGLQQLGLQPLGLQQLGLRQPGLLHSRGLWRAESRVSPSVEPPERSVCAHPRFFGKDSRGGARSPRDRSREGGRGPRTKNRHPRRGVGSAPESARNNEPCSEPDPWA